MSLKEEFREKTRRQLQKELGLKNPMAVPTLQKINVVMGIGSKRDDKAFVTEAQKDMAAICGQKPNTRPAKKSLAGFSVRQGQLVGLRVTLRGRRMWDFFEKFVKSTLPRMRDFRGISKKSMDKCGNISVGIPEHTVFAEIDPNKVDKIKPLGVVITTTARDDEYGYALLKALGFPFKD